MYTLKVTTDTNINASIKLFSNYPLNIFDGHLLSSILTKSQAIISLTLGISKQGQGISVVAYLHQLTVGHYGH